MDRISVSLVSRLGTWQDVRDSARNTVWKKSLGEDKEVSSEFKRKMLMSEHSPIRLLQFKVRMEIPYWVSVHLVRHKLGVEHFVSTQRDDRQVTGQVKLDAAKDIFAGLINHYLFSLFGKEVPRKYKMQGEPVIHEMMVNAQSLIFISRKRLCYLASPETTATVQKIKNLLSMEEPELAAVMVPECIYRGFCPEEPCKSRYAWTPKFLRDLLKYRSTIGRR